MRCAVCGAPGLPLAEDCVFCHSPLPPGGGEGEAPGRLLVYLGERVPRARVTRSGLLRRGPVSGLSVSCGGESFQAGVRGGELVLEPHLEIAAWVDRLLAALSRDAARDADLRAVVTRSGWALRP